MTSTSEQFLNSKDILDLFKVNFCINNLLIQCNTGSCCVHVTGGFNIYLYIFVCQSVGPSVSYVCLSVCVYIKRVISNQTTSKNHAICVKPSVHLMPCSIKRSKVLSVQRYQGSTSGGGAAYSSVPNNLNF